MRKIIILISVLILGVGYMAYKYFSDLYTENNSKDLALQSATSNAALVFSFRYDKSFYTIMEGQSLLQKVIGAEKMNVLTSVKRYMSSDSTLEPFFYDQQTYISVLPDTNSTLNFLFTTSINPDQKPDRLHTLLKSKRFNSDKSHSIHSIQLDDSTVFYIATKGNILTGSTSYFLVKNAMVESNHDNAFAQYIKDNNQHGKNILARLFINFNYAPLWLKQMIAGNLNGEIAVLNKQNSFAVLNYNFSEEKILFNGNMELNDGQNYLKTFEDMHPQKIYITDLLPSNTANYVVYAMDNYNEWSKKLRTWQKLKNEDSKAEVVNKNVFNDYRIDLKAIFPAYSKNQFMVFQLNTAEKLGAIALTNGEKVKQLLLELSNDYNDDIRLFKSSDILTSYYGEPFKKFGRPYYTIIDNYLVFANNASTVQVFLNSYKSNRVLLQDEAYLNATNQISTTSNIIYYINLKNSGELFRSNLTLPYYRYIRADSGLKSFDTFYFQMESDQKKFMTNLLLNKYLKIQVPDSLSHR